MSHEALSEQQFADVMEPRTFGPGGKYMTRTGTFPGERRNYVEAVHTNSGRRIGAMNWFSTPVGSGGAVVNKVGQTVEPDKPTIFKVVVSPNMRRKGVATALLEHARAISPGLQHSHALTPEGAAWAKARP